MIVRLLGGSDEVQGETPGPYVRTLWVRFGIYKQNKRAIYIHYGVANSLRKYLSNIQIPHDMDYVVSTNIRSLRSASALWAEVPLNLPGLIKVIQHSTT